MATPTSPSSAPAALPASEESTFHPSLGQPGCEVIYHPSPLLKPSEEDENEEDTTFTVSIPPASLPHIFAHRQWRAGMILADLLISPTSSGLIEGKVVLELGCGTALPALVAARAGAAFVLATDYDEEQVVRVLRQNVGRALREDPDLEGRVKGAGYTWGRDPDDIFDLLPTPPSRSGGGKFDTIVLADTLWDPLSHADLAKSLSLTLSKTREARVVVVAGLHTGRERIGDFVRKVRRVGLEILPSSSSRESDREGVSLRGLWDELERIDEPSLEALLSNRHPEEIASDEWMSSILEFELAPDSPDSSSPSTTIHARGPRLTGRRRTFVAEEKYRPEEGKERGGVRVRNRWMTLWMLEWGEGALATRRGC
ncbi:hypothetical protein A4X06_0g5849 [Tilletia controversa]|uniref:Protein N-terminal and lysine N-methyltransferase EFM7 n=2 Tax=Tilletia TaxID=13289 RepID=A0A8X7MQC1_9BASI|nr:hypothetical protein CF328_g9166 [Tilletia controversa]KAE8188176.1 hypothetical protein CF336_g6265 [Tilletia laevis]KAE8237046.1 hypothetical protein A4X03_0g9241 [Tilletia caries]KAE8245041.1 hypothetical protein A4X06_0g5849 [Tilletia controversa]